MFDIKNPDGSRIDFSEISLESLGYHLIFGDVDSDTMKDAVDFIIKANLLFPKQELTLLVNSPGGTCSDGFALIDIMHTSRLPIRTIASGCIMSMGVLLACAGHKGKRVMTRNTEVMAHQYAWGEDSIKFHELVARREAQEYLAYQFVQHFKRHSTMTEAQIKDVLFGPSDRWLTPAECKKFGLIDHVVDELPTITVPLAAAAELPLGTQLKRRTRAQTSGTGQQKKR
jgi:ATP-dependent Clp protease protease subunit